MYQYVPHKKFVANYVEREQFDTSLGVDILHSNVFAFGGGTFTWILKFDEDNHTTSSKTWLNSGKCCFNSLTFAADCHQKIDFGLMLSFSFHSAIYVYSFLYRLGNFQTGQIHEGLYHNNWYNNDSHGSYYKRSGQSTLYESSYCDNDTAQSFPLVSLAKPNQTREVKRHSLDL